MEEPKITDWIAVGISGFAIIVSIAAVCYSRVQMKIAKRALVFARSSARSAETSAKTAEKAVGEGFRPYVVVKLYSLDLALYFEIINIGNREAHDVKIKISPSFENYIPYNLGYNRAISGLEKLFNQEVLYPNSSIRTVLASNEKYLDSDLSKTDDRRLIEIEYNSKQFDSSGKLSLKKYSEEINLNISNFLIADKIAEKTNKELKDIKKSIDDTAKAVKNIKYTVTKTPNSEDNKYYEGGIIENDDPQIPEA